MIATRCGFFSVELPPLVHVDQAIAFLDELDDVFVRLLLERSMAGQPRGAIFAGGAIWRVRQVRDHYEWLADYGSAASSEALARLLNFIAVFDGMLSLPLTPIQPRYQ